MKKLLRAILCATMLFVSILSSACAEGGAPEFSSMSIEELLNMRNEINLMLEQKGYIVYFDIERGTKGEDVSAIQTRLTELGFYTGKITGKFDSETQKAFKQFEKANSVNNDGTASREDQILLFSKAAIAKVIEAPVNTAAPKTSEKRIEHDVSFDYEQCMRYPDDYMGKTYTLKGRVEQTMGSRTGGFQIRFAVLGNTDEIIYVYINEDPGYNIIDNDWLIIEVAMAGTITYESIWRQKITIPAAVASSITLR